MRPLSGSPGCGIRLGCDQRSLCGAQVTVEKFEDVQRESVTTLMKKTTKSRDTVHTTVTHDVLDQIVNLYIENNNKTAHIENKSDYKQLRLAYQCQENLFNRYYMHSNC